MSWFLPLILMLTLGATPPATPSATVPPSTPPSAGAPAINNVDDLLNAVNASDSKINTLSTTIRYETVQALLDDKQVRKGTAVLSISPDRRLKQFRVSFTEFITERGLERQSRDYIFDGRYLVERLNDEKQFLSREVVRPGEEMDPLAIDGPLPLPIGQSRETILKRFTATMLDNEADETDRLKGGYRMRLTARNKADDLETVDLWYDPITLLPGRALITQRGGDTVRVDLVNTTINDADVDPAQFNTKAPPAKDGWRVEIRAMEDGTGR